jgi:hypothetical protein
MHHCGCSPQDWRFSSKLSSVDEMSGSPCAAAPCFRVAEEVALIVDRNAHVLPEH